MVSSQGTAGKPSFSKQMATAMGVATFLQEVASVLLALLVVRLVVGREWRRLLAWRRPSAMHLLLAILFLPGMLIVPDRLVEAAKHVLPSFDYQSQVEEMIGPWPWWFAVLVIGLGPGFWEELWCRGFIGRGLVGRYGFLGGVLLTSLLFGLLHLDPVHAVGTAFLGMCLHFVYVTTRSLWVPMLLHTMNNSVGVLAITVGPEEMRDKEPVPWLIYLAGVGLLTAVGWAMYQSRARCVSVTAGPQWQPDFPGVELPPAESGVVVVSPWPSVTASVLLLLALVLFGTSLWPGLR
jgi:membrane protease YdiL (CAAX protease family)